MAVSANTRTLNVDLVKAVGGSDWEGAIIRAKLLTKIAVSGTEVMPPQYDDATTLADGTTTMTLATPPDDGTAWLYQFQIKDSSNNLVAEFEAEVAYGVADLEFSALIAAAGLVGSESPNSLSTLIDAHAADDDAHHDPVTIGTNTASALSLTGQVLSLLDVFLKNTDDTFAGLLDIDGTIDLDSASGSDYMRLDVNDTQFNALAKIGTRIANILFDSDELKLLFTDASTQQDGYYIKFNDLTSLLIGSNDGTQLLTIDSDGLKLALPSGDVINFQDEVLQRPVIQDYQETINNIGDFGGGTQDIDHTLGPVHQLTISTSTVTLTFSNWGAVGATPFTLELTNAGSQTINWPAAVTWPNGGAEPNWTTSGVDIVTGYSLDGGTTIRLTAILDMQ